MKVLTVVGARPQFIKAAPVSIALAEVEIMEIVVHTGQHYDAGMSAVFFDELGMRPPAHSLGLGGGSHGEQTGRMLPALESIVQREMPDAVLIYGDTNSTLAGALAAAKLHVPIAHVEAGLRSFNRRMPEEINRVVADALATILFAPTTVAAEHLAREGAEPGRVHLVGDVMYDVAIAQRGRAMQLSEIIHAVNVPEHDYVLVTVHRAENTDDPARLRVIVAAIERIALHRPVVWPVHPRTRRAAGTALEGLARLGVRVIDPVGFLDMVRLEVGAAVIMTDSGGVQKEAFFHEIPCVTVRDETEWTELVELGWNRLAPPRDAVTLAEQVLNAIGTRGKSAQPYGTGDAARRIARVLAAIAPGEAP